MIQPDKPTEVVGDQELVFKGMSRSGGDEGLVGLQSGITLSTTVFLSPGHLFVENFEDGDCISKTTIVVLVWKNQETERIIIPFEGSVAVCDGEHEHLKLCGIGRECEKHRKRIIDTYMNLFSI